jgi:hypothetical protein
MKTLFMAVAILTLGVSAMAQEEYPRTELFGGYQFTHLGPSLNANGWNAAVNGNLNRCVGVTGDFSGSYKGTGHMYTFIFGPAFSVRTKWMTPFDHALFGGATIGDGGEFGGAFSMGLGGGMDVNAGNHLAMRLVQADWILLHSGGETARRRMSGSRQGWCSASKQGRTRGWPCPPFVQDHQHVLALLGNKNHGVTAGPIVAVDRHDPPPAALTLQQNSIVVFLADGRIQLQGATQDLIAGQVISSMIPRSLFLAEIGIPGIMELQRGLRKLDSFEHASRKL